MKGTDEWDSSVCLKHSFSACMDIASIYTQVQNLKVFKNFEI